MIHGAERFLAATQCRPTDATPVWFMRQAGRSLPRYRELRERFGFLELATNSELSAEVTCMPVEILGVDAAVVFADIMLPLQGMAVDFEIRESVGPVVTRPIRSERQVSELRVVAAEEATPYLFPAIRGAREQLGRRAALIGFGAAPFTLACYLVEGQGSRDYPHVRSLIHSDPQLWDRLMTILTEVLARYLIAQAQSGADVVQLFDSWAGVLDRATFVRHVAPHLQALIRRLQPLLPVVYFSTASSHLLESVVATGPDGLSVDWRIPLGEAWDRLGHERFIQGNLDPATVLAPWPVLEAGAREVLLEADHRPGHIFNLGHGVLPESSPEQLKRLVDLVHESGPSRSDALASQQPR
ncbi:MAG TPA: uroporphyrinogen decarboxylase [Candidatus Micrarchaeaceae archaeon]|nr:uroporphyrinogen decarboxylase [Candidatus Micrarchaeaceae archaeon]